MKSSEAAYVNSVRNAESFGIKDKVGYFLGDLGFNSLQVLVNTYLMLFCVNIIGIEAIHFSIIIFICKALDALNDTFIGRVVDLRPGSKHGKFKPFIWWFAIPYAISTIILFANISATPYWFKIVYCVGIYFIWGVVGTFINVPYGAMVNSMTSNQMERTELSNARSVGSLGANIITTTIAPLILFDAMNNPVAGRFIHLALILSVFTVICLAVTHKLCRERIVVSIFKENAEEKEKIDYLKVIKTFAKNRPMIAVVVAYIVAKFFLQTTGLTNQYVFMTYFQDTGKLAAIGLGTLVPMVLAMICLKPLVKLFGKKKMITVPFVIAAILYTVLAIFPVSAGAWIIIQLVASFFTGFFSLLVWSLIADAVDYQAYLSGARNDGTVYATITFLVFFISSLSTSLIAVLLDAVGYDASLGSMQAANVANNIKTMAGILPTIGCILIFICFFVIYNMNDEKMKEISAYVNKQSEKLEESFDK
jgi:GPH family glycoside/pentoside/hexuronide:cation symporter